MKTRNVDTSKGISKKAKSSRVVKFHPKYIKHLRNVREKLTGEPANFVVDAILLL